ncbi:antA/AntB antirepressor family protein [Spirosoma validum]|uniref:AntA/AntB antirepressor family protein n=1 Tax=Spirosoma validum TaxID=2771355 RepID=A0A927AZB3_9BACT|nr:antA/AntB antirepressor family protein [Spirosoma validum]MBD2752629.1 antA/AntB antirepressor family protein [Spirosoma validum]
MTELISITTNEQGVSIVSARELFEFLGLDKTHWSRWSKKNIVDNPFASEGTDWTGFAIMANGNQTSDYAISIDFAKKLSMKAPTEKGEQVRQYFIEAEKALRKLSAPAALPADLTLLNLISQQTQLLTGQAQLITQLRADVDQINRGTRPIQPAPVRALPTSSSPGHNAQLRERFLSLISNYCAYHQADFASTYNYLYRRMHDVYGVNVHRLNRAGNESLLDTIERYGRLADLYKLASNELIYLEEKPVRLVKHTLDNITDEQRQAIFRRAFLLDESLLYAQLRANLMEASEIVGVPLAKTRAEVFITRAVNLGYLLKHRNPGQRYECYRLNQQRFPI